jgi:sarcosine oxidase subunit delta
MRIACPFCGEREVGEFSYLGDASPRRPHYTIDDGSDPVKLREAFYDYVYLRDNVAGTMREYWYHGGGCRSWLIAERDTRTHEFRSVQAAGGAGASVTSPAGE